jgi:DNA-binding beta-propeller fold protein YncE
MIVAVHGRNDLAAIDPVSFTVTERISTPGDHPHGQALDETDQVMFVGCEANATMVTVDLADRSVIDRQQVGETPDVLAYDPGAKRVAFDLTTHHSYFPVPKGRNGSPVLWEFKPT